MWLQIQIDVDDDDDYNDHVENDNDDMDDDNDFSLFTKVFCFAFPSVWTNPWTIAVDGDR